MLTSSKLKEKIRVFRWKRQGLALALEGSKADRVLVEAGWIRSVGGASPYLALKDRAGLSRADVDRAVAKLDICELPATRGCTYVVPKADFALALQAGRGHSADAEIAAAKKFCGVTDKELEKLTKKVLAALAAEALDPAAIKEVAGDAVRSLGPDGKKRGLTTTLPLVLGRLQSEGEIRRIPIDGRLDRQRYKYARWTPNPMGKKELTDDELAIELTRRFFHWAGPATVAQLAWWAGISMKAAKVAVAELSLVPMAEDDGRLSFAADRNEILDTEIPKTPSYSFVGLLDNIQHPRRETMSLLTDEDAGIDVPDEKGTRPGGALSDLTYHPIIDRGRLIGLWDYDGLKNVLVYRTFGKAPASLVKSAEAIEKFMQEELGDVRTMSLDSPESRVERIEALVKAKFV